MRQHELNELKAAHLAGLWMLAVPYRMAAIRADVCEFTARRYYGLFDWAKAYDCDPPPPRYTGPTWIGKAIDTIVRSVPRGHVDHLPQSDSIGAR